MPSPLVGPTLRDDLPRYPPLSQMCRVTTSTVPGPSGYRSASVLGAVLYVAFVQQLRTDTLLPRDREPCLVDDLNGLGLAPGYYEGRLSGSWTGLPVYAVGASGAPGGGGGGPGVVVGGSSAAAGIGSPNLVGLNPAQISLLLLNLSPQQLAALNNLNACQLQAIMTLNISQVQDLTSTLTNLQIGKLYDSVTQQNASKVTDVYVQLTKDQLRTYTTYFSSSVVINEGATTSQVINLLKTITDGQASTLTTTLGYQQITNLLVSLSASQIQTLVASASASQLTAIANMTPAQIAAAGVNITTLLSLNTNQLTALARYTPQQISALFSNLTAAQVQTFLNNSSTNMDTTTIFGGQTSSSISTRQDNVSLVNKQYKSFNPTVNNTKVTGFLPTSPQVAQVVVVVNTSLANALVLAYNDVADSTYPILNATAADYTLAADTAVAVAYDPTVGKWAILTAAVTSSGGGGTGLLTAVRVYDHSGSPWTWTKPAGLVFVEVEVLDSGGGGGGTTGAPSQIGAASAGAGGCWQRAKIAAASLSATETVTVPAGGAGGAAGANDGVSGAASSFGSHVAGGTAGHGLGYNAATTVQADVTLGGAGVAGSGGDVIVPGQYGGAGVVISGGNHAFCAPGGSSMYGAGGGTVIVGNDGRTATGYGAGGSGGVSFGANQAGGAGSGGLVIVREYS